MISHYRILEKLGVVYKAEDTKLKRTVVLEFLLLSGQVQNHPRPRSLSHWWERDVADEVGDRVRVIG